jgi:hypothetical protein
MDRVYEAAWAQIEARDPFRDRNEDGKRQDALRKRLFALATPKVLARMPNIPAVFTAETPPLP